MDTFIRRHDIQHAPFKSAEPPAETRYGLPREIKFCTSCVISNQRPNSAVEFAHNQKSRKETIHFDEDGVCDACHVARRKKETDWEERERELIELCTRFRRADGRYDCVVPGSGGKDSFYAAHVLKYRYGMHPLTVTWAPHIYTDWGWKNLMAWINAGFDNILKTPNSRVHRLLTRLALENLFHPFQPFIIGQKSIAAKFSALYDIPLVFYGENEAEYGNPQAEAESEQRDWSYFTTSSDNQIYLSGISIADLKDRFGLHQNDLEAYLPVDPDHMRRAGTQVHYLGYYLPWHPQGCYYYSVEHGGFVPSPERTAGTYSKYNSIDDKVDDLHYYTAYIKFGIGRATSDASQESRNGDITRDEAVALVKRYDGEFPERFIDELFEYLSLPTETFPAASGMFEQPIMDRDYFMHLADRFRPPHIWKYENGAWCLRKTVWD